MTDVLITSAHTNADKLATVMIRRDLEDLLRTPPAYLQPGSFVRADFVPGSNGTMRFLAIPDFDVVTGTPTAGTPPWLTEGVTPDADDITYAYEEFSANQAGRVRKFTDIADLKSLVDLLPVISNRMARQALMTVDQRVGDVVHAGTNVIYSGSGNAARADLASTDTIARADFIRAVASLQTAGVPTFPDGTYHGLIHPNVAGDIKLDTSTGSWVDVSKYANPSEVLTGEIGTYYGVRLAVSNKAGLFALGGGVGTFDVYSTIVYGPNYYAFGDFASLMMNIQPPGSGDDILKQRTKVGWKAFIGARLLEAVDSRYIRIESASSL